MEKICIIRNESKSEALSFYNETVEYFRQKGYKTYGREGIPEADIAVVIGGDGTLLRAAKELVKNTVISRLRMWAGFFCGRS